MGKKRNVYGTMVGRRGGKMSLKNHKPRWEDNIKMKLKIWEQALN
jgi:hypothetical protein